MNGMDQLRPVELRLMDPWPIAQEWLERAMAIEPDDNLVRYNAPIHCWARLMVPSTCRKFA